MPVDLEKLNLRAWVVDSERRPLPHFNLRKIAPDTIESWIPSVAGEKFAIYFNGQNNSPGQNVLDIHATAELDGRLKLDGVVLPAAHRAGGYVGGILDQPVRIGKARPLKFGRLRVTDEDNESSNGSKHTIIKVKLEWGRFREIRTLDKFRNPMNRGTVHERVVKDGNLASTILGKKFGTSPVHGSEPEESLDVISRKNKNKMKRNTSLPKEGSVKRLKSEEYTKPLSSTRPSGLGWGGKQDIKTEPTD